MSDAITVKQKEMNLTYEQIELAKKLKAEGKSKAKILSAIKALKSTENEK